MLKVLFVRKVNLGVLFQICQKLMLCDRFIDK